MQMRSRTALALLVSTATALVTAVSGCAARGPLVLVDPPPIPGAWATVGLKLEGPEASVRGWRACVAEAGQVGVNLSQSAPNAVTLTLDRRANRLDSLAGSSTLGRWSMPALCRVAIATAVGLDHVVPVFHPGAVPPVGCEERGLFEASYDLDIGDHRAAASEKYAIELQMARWKTRAMGGNVLVISREDDRGWHGDTYYGLIINGRALACPASQLATMAPTLTSAPTTMPALPATPTQPPAGPPKP
jgi:hypothetical protein